MGKNTHLIGEALLKEQKEEAFALLKEAGSPDSKRAVKFEGGSVEFF
ncbi:hypothetical protein [Candidatus Erwinia dacicola]|nr:hypothetical protein [Candidatus Erwinia dacicola]